ncbi:protein abrupt-like [Macrosteles quadrilineatus]|uniref:protein abrupt-like n=1 Tax=Macrosteles quadrilineatus TaxID=74068 RepID=UPI0023E09202|nr:protein abrupt-like [Macrosteles quadrilineatus]
MYEDSSEQFSLRWNNFFSNLTSGFHSLWEEEDFVDVTLAADGKFIQAHKIVLSVCSPYFKHLFKVNPCKHPIVILKDVGYKELSGLLQFMYKGEVNVYQEELADFLKTAELLQIKGLTSNDSQTNPQKEESKETKPAPSPVQTEEKKKQNQSPTPSLPVKRKRPDAEQNNMNNTHRVEANAQYSLPALPPLEPIDFVESEFPENCNDRLARLFDVDSSKPVTNKPGQRLIANFSQDPMDAAQATFRVTSRGRLQLVQNNYVYHCNRQKDNKIFWKCAEYNRTGCRGRCISIGWAVTVTHALHNHHPVWSEGSDDSKIISDFSEMKKIFGSPRSDGSVNPALPAYQKSLASQPDNNASINLESF